MSTISKNLKDWKKTYSDLKAKALNIQKENTPESPLSDEDIEAYKALQAKIAAAKAQIAALEDMEEEEKASVKEGMDDDMEMSKSFTPTKRETKASDFRYTAKQNKGSNFARFVMGAGLASKWGNLKRATDYIEKSFEDYSIVKALNTMTQANGGALIPAEFQQELIDLLYSETVVRASGARTYPTGAGNLTIPRVLTGATASWLANQTTAITTSGQTFDNIQLTARGLAAMVPVANVLIETSPLAVESIIREDMARQMALAEDTAFLFGASGGANPTGLLNLGVGAVASTGVTLAEVSQFLYAMELSLTANNVSVKDAVWVMHPAVMNFLKTITDSVGYFVFKNELDQGMLLGHKVYTTALIPTNVGTTPNFESYVYFYNPKDLIIADSINLIADSSSDATYVIGGTTYSAYQLYQTVFRTLKYVDFNIRHLQSAVVGTVTNWTPAGYTVTAGFGYPATTPNTGNSFSASAYTSNTNGT